MWYISKEKPFRCHFDQSIETKLRLSSPGVAPCAIILQIAGMTFGIIKKYIFTNYLLHDSLLRLKLQEIQNNIVIYWPKLTKTFFSVYLVGLDYPRFPLTAVAKYLAPLNPCEGLTDLTKQSTLMI